MKGEILPTSWFESLAARGRQTFVERSRQTTASFQSLRVQTVQIQARLAVRVKLTIAKLRVSDAVITVGLNKRNVLNRMTGDRRQFAHHNMSLLGLTIGDMEYRRGDHRRIRDSRVDAVSTMCVGALDSVLGLVFDIWTRFLSQRSRPDRRCRQHFGRNFRSIPSCAAPSHAHTLPVADVNVTARMVSRRSLGCLVGVW